MTAQPDSLLSASAPVWDTGSNADFFKYYEEQSLAPATLERFRATTEMLLRLGVGGPARSTLDVADIGCGAGAQARFWLEKHHRYWGIDINEPLIALARERARREGLDARFEVGSATSLPLPDASMDVCVLPELLEHVKDWRGCVDEAVRILRPGGLMYINTSSKLCPVQQEFNLPLYSWYPGPLKRYFERRAVTDRPSLVNHAKYPAVNWFSFYGLRAHLRARQFESWDRFDLARSDDKSALARAALGALRHLPPLRLLGHLATPYTLLIARKAG